MHDWKVLYRDDLDRDRTSRSIPSREAALKQARDLYINERAHIYSIDGPNGRTLAKQEGSSLFQMGELASTSPAMR